MFPGFVLAFTEHVVRPVTQRTVIAPILFAIHDKIELPSPPSRPMLLINLRLTTMNFVCHLDIVHLESTWGLYVGKEKESITIWILKIDAR